MIKLFQILKRLKNVFLFLILLVICINLIARQNRIQSVDIINSSNAIVGLSYSFQNGIVGYFQLKRMNADLMSENARLRNLLASQSGIDTFQDFAKQHPILELDTSLAKRVDTSRGAPKDSLLTGSRKLGEAKVVKFASYHYIPARVISNSIVSGRMNYITINRGSDDGIRKNMAVVSSQGIVGRVANTSAHYATILTVLSENRTYNARLKDGTEAMISWELGSSSAMNMNNIPKVIPAQKGDSVFTAGFSFFPADICIGTVAKVDTMNNGSAKKLKIRMTTNFRKLQYVYVVSDKLSEERKRLERNTQANP